MTEVLESILAFDTWLFYAINTGMANWIFDEAMPVVTNTAYWRPIYAGALLLLIWRGGRRGRWCAAALLVAVAALDPLSLHLLKEPIGRLRPYDALEGVRQLVDSGAGSFPSNHALNNAAAATILTFFYRRRWVLWWTIALTVSYSRVYCGVHWPTDIAAGLVIGALGGWAVIALVKLAWRRTSLAPHEYRYGRPLQ